MHKWPVVKARNPKPVTYVFLSTIVVASLLPLIWFFADGDSNYLLLSLSMLVLLGGGTFYIGFVAPERLFYETDDSFLLIRSPFGARRLLWKQIISVECKLRPRLTQIIGVALPDLQYGLFHADGVGAINVYSRDIGSKVVVLTLVSGKPILLAPKNQDIFVQHVRGHLNVS